MSTPRAENLSKQRLGKVLVTGGRGGLAHQILLLLETRQICAELHSLDIRAPRRPLEKVYYHAIDLTTEHPVRALFELVRPDVVVHCASPRYDATKDAMLRINVEGTKCLVNIAKEYGTKAFVYTSSASVISDAQTDLKGADESYPLVIGDNQPEFYVHTKALAESYVLSQNCSASRQPFLTCAIRPSGIFGARDSWVLPGILEANRRGQTKVQISDNRNLFDFTESTNVAYAHHLAAAALIQSSLRNGAVEEHERVDGEAFFITNDEPLPFWDFTRMVWRFAGDATRPDQIWVLSRQISRFLAGSLELLYWMFMLGDPPLTKTKVRLSCMTRYYSIRKAKVRLGYQPLVGLEEGLRRGVEDSVKQYCVQK